MPASYGSIAFHPGINAYLIDAVPHVRGRIRRFFPSIKQQGAHIMIPETDSNCEDLEMLVGRWPLTPRDGGLDRLLARAADARERMQACERILTGNHILPLETLLPLREYQHAAVALLMHRKKLLCGDDLGLGKTAVAIGAIAAGATPAIIVCQNHLTRQWRDEIHKFLGKKVRVHLQLTGADRTLPAHEVLVMPYSMLTKWADRLGGYKLVVFDEMQELRRSESGKYAAAQTLAATCEMALGLTATPVYNYGDEIFNLLSLLEFDCLGPRDEFLREWCVPAGSGHYSVTDAKALGSFLAERHLFLRRRRDQVGRELPPLNRVVEDVQYNERMLEAISGRALQLARAILSPKSDFNTKGQAARQLSLLLRQQTGIAKAPFVAEFVADLVASGERVVLCGWHREVYAVWQTVFKNKGIPHFLYTGTEGPRAKEIAVRGFTTSRDPGVFIMSLRSGAGLNGLQEKSSIIVFGELDWSPQVHNQCIGRLRRDPQPHSVTAVFLVASAGSDPIISYLLGLKREQSDGINDPDKEIDADQFGDKAEESHGVALAKGILGKLQPKH